MNVIGIDVSRGKSHATLITTDFEKQDFNFSHNRSGFKQLAAYLADPVLVIFETTGVYSAQLAYYLSQNKIKFCELNPLEAKMRMSSLRRNKTDASDSFKLAVLGITQAAVIRTRSRHYIDIHYQSLRFLAEQYHKLSRERVRIENQLRSALELSFPELNDIFPVIRSVVALQMIRKYAHPDYLAGLTVKGMTEQLYRVIGKHITRKLIASYCTKVWTAALNSYPAIAADSIEISIIGMLCDEIEGYNQRVALIKDQLIKKADSFPEFKLISSIPGAGQLNTALLMGFAGNIERFENYKQLNAYLGIDLNRYQSGTLVKHDKINRRGNSFARTVEIEMIKSMLRNQGRINNHLVDYYYKLKEPPYSKKDLVAQIACVNHLNRTIMHLVHTNQSYDYQQAVRQ